VIVAVALMSACAGQQEPHCRGPSPGEIGYQISFPAFGGHLLGADHGEFGGELAFRSPDGQITKLAEKNIIGLYRMPFGHVAISGLWHMGAREGEIFLVTQRSPQQLRLDLLAQLPYAPTQSWQRQDGSVDLALFTGDYQGVGPDAPPIFTCVKLTIAKNVERMPCPQELRVAL
jgi:hypothetical protein